MNLLKSNKDVRLNREEIYNETAEMTFEVIQQYLHDPERYKERIIEILKTDYKLIHLLTKRHNLK